MFLFSCSRVEVAFDWAPRIMTNYLDDQFDFSSKRYTAVKTAFKKDLEQNKSLIKEEILKHLDTLIEQTSQSEVTDEKMKNFILQIQETQKKIVYAFKPTFEEVLKPMPPEELSYFKSELEKRWKKIDERQQDEADFKKRMIKRFKDSMESYFNDVTPAQIQMYEVYFNENKDRIKLRPQKRQEWFKKFEELFTNKEELVTWVLKISANETSQKTPEQAKEDQASIEISQKFMQNLWPTLTDKQKNYFKKELVELKESFLQL